MSTGGPSDENDGLRISPLVSGVLRCPGKHPFRVDYLVGEHRGFEAIVGADADPARCCQLFHQQARLFASAAAKEAPAMEVDDEALGGFQITCTIEIEEVCCPVGAIADGASPCHAASDRKS